MVKKYNFDKKKVGFLHPKVDDLVGNKDPIDQKKLDLLNEIEHKKENFHPCAQPWSSVHINVDGTVFPCLAVSMGNIQDNSIFQSAACNIELVASLCQSHACNIE